MTGSRRRGWGVFLGLGVVSLAWPARADNLAYVRASSQLDHELNQATYHPLNLLDDDPATVWCEGDRDLGEAQEIRVIFKKPQRIDRIVVAPSLGSGRLVEQVRVSDGVNSVVIPLGEQEVEQPVSPPMKGTVYTLSIERVGGPNKSASLGNDVSCLAAFVLYFGKAPFGGSLKPSELRYDKYRDQLLGDWNGEPFGAAEKFITFAIDGTWSWRFMPLMKGGPKKQALSGEYRFRGNRLLMRKGDAGRWADVAFKSKRVKVDPDAIGAPMRDYRVIVLNKAVVDELAGEYNDAEFH